MSLPRPPQHLINRRFGRLIVQSLRHIPLKGEGRWIYKAGCLCDCGKSKEIFTSSLLRGATTSCGCDKSRYIKTTGERNKNFKGYKGIRAHFWGGYQTGAKKRGIPFNISIEFAWNLYEKQGGKCALSGVPIVFQAGKNSRTTASLDRIDNAQGYVEGNVQWVHKQVNIMRNTLGVQEFVAWCAHVVFWNGGESIDLTNAPDVDATSPV